MKRLLFFLILLSFSFPLLSQVAQQVTFDEALSTALLNNNLLNAAKSQINKAEGLKKESFSYYLPQVDLTLNYSKTDNPVYVFMGKLTQERFGMSDFAIASLNNPDPLQNYQGRITLTLPLFTGGKIRAYNRASNYGIEVSKNQYEDAKAKVKKGVTEAFYGAILARKAVKVFEEAFKTVKAHEERISAMHKEGLVLDSDLLRIRVYLSDVEQEFSSKKAEYEIAKSYLGYAMGVNYPVEPKGDIEEYKNIEITLDEAIKMGQSKNKELLAMVNIAKQAKEGVKIKKADYFPQIGMMASYERDYTENGTYGKNWMVGIEVKIPLFDGGRRGGTLLQAKSDEISTFNMLSDLRSKIDTQIRESYLKLKSLEERLKVTESQVEQALENQRIVSKRYEEGMALITELLDADILVTTTKLSRAKSFYDVIVEKSHLSQLLGDEQF